MSRIRIIVAVVVATMLFGYALVTVQASAERNPGEGSEHAERPVTRAPNGQTQQVRSSGATFDHQVSRRRWEAMLPDRGGIEPASSLTRAASTADDAVEGETREVQRALVFYTQSHAQQPRDSSWSHEQEEQVSDLLANEAFAGTTLEEVDCRTSQCRVVVVHQDKEAIKRLRQVWGHGPFRHGGYSYFDEQARSTTIYLGREGYEFPYPDLGAAPSEEDASGESASR